MVRSLLPPALAAALAAALAGCGGGGASESPADAQAAPRINVLQAAAAANWVAVEAPADPLLQNLPVPADAPTRGMWSGVQKWPLNGLHATVLPNGKLISYGTSADGNNQDGRYIDVWDPSLGFGDGAHSSSYRNDRQDSFCSSAAYLNDGRLMITGGNGSVTSTLYTPDGDRVAQSAANLADERWYTTLLTLPDARQIALGGMVPYAEGMQDKPDQAVAQGLASMTPEVYENGAWRSLAGAYSRDAFGPDYLRASYPRAWVAPSGKVFGISAERMWTLDPAGNGGIVVHGAFKNAPSANAANAPNVGATNTAAMYDIGKLLVVGGNGSYNGDELPASRLATAIDINGAAPVLTEQPAMSYARRYGNAIALPDGRVLVTGGTTYGNMYNGQPAASVTAAEIWNPATGAWTVGANAAVFRGYHSFTALLPNGTVLSLGGGTPGPVTNLNAEVYYPPQLFRAVNGGAQLAPRPVMKGINGRSYAHGDTLQVDMAGDAAIGKLVLIGLSSGTHSFNNGQRRIPLAFAQDGIRLTATLPNSFLAPPGYYQVVAVDAAGVPSRGTIVAIGQNVSPPPGAGTPYNPPEISSGIGAPIIAAGGTARYSVPVAAGVSYRWDFGDGSAASAASADPAVSHAYANPGVYAVTLTATGSGGAVTRRTFLQAVSTTPTARAPQASGAMALEVRAAAAPTNLAPAATLATSSVSAWESLAAVNDNAVPANSADRGAGAYGNWRGEASYGQSDWVSFAWDRPKALSAFEVYWWNDGQGIATPIAAQVEYWNGTGWTPAGAIGTALNAFNRLDLAVTTTRVRVAMRSARATGILEARVLGSDAVPPRLWVANPDTDTVAAIDAGSYARVAEIAVGSQPRGVAVAPDGRVWVINKNAATVSIVDPATMAVAQTVALPRGSRPHGLVFAPGGGSAYLVLEATGQLLRLDPGSGAVRAAVPVGANPRHVSVSADAATVLVSRYITPALPGESTAAVDTGTAGGEVVAVDAASLAVVRTVVLRHSDKVDNETQGSGIPNYLGAAVVSPDGRSAWVPSKQDNVKRGVLRNGQNLNFQNTVRAISSRIDLAAMAEDYSRRVDHDNSGVGTAAAFHPSGAYLFVALETSRQIAVVDAIAGRELMKVDVGRAPQAVSVSPDGRTAYVQNYMDRTVTVLDLGPLVSGGELRLPVVATASTIGAETLGAQVLAGKQLFYDARDPRLARDAYMSCASCHNDGGHDGRTWDLGGFGEGLRNTIELKGRAGMRQGLLHWSGNFDEVQDFEKQIRDLAGGTGLMADADYNYATRNQAQGTPKAGVSADLDALAAYVGSLAAVDPSPHRAADGSATAAAVAGRAVFVQAQCATCHGGEGFTASALGGGMRGIGTLRAGSGNRLGAPLTGIDVPTLRGLWATAPYLHDGRAATLADAVQAHAGNAVRGDDLANLAAYLQQIDGTEGAVAPPLPDGVYRLVAKHSKQALNIDAASKADGAGAIQSPWAAGDDERWRIAALGNGDYALTAQHSGKRLEVANCAATNGGRVQQWPGNGAACQAWRIEPLNDGTFRLVNKSSGKVLDVSAVSQNAGAAVFQWEWTGGDNQRWRIEPVSPNAPAAGPFSLAATHSGKVLDVLGVSQAVGAPVVQWNWAGGGNQKWTALAAPDGFFELAPTHAPGMRLEVAGGGLNDGDRTQQGAASGSAAQRWAFEQRADGGYRIINRNSGKALDVSNVSKDDGATVHQWTWLNGANQWWTLVNR
ncbi:MAG: RICIN domain-containing protein [Xylophilus ampelinus]